MPTAAETSTMQPRADPLEATDITIFGSSFIFLAQELCDIIIDFLHDSPATLIACALVCSAWRPSAQFHLFRDVKICPDLDHYRGYRTIPAPSQLVTVPRCAKFCAALRSSAHLIPLVRSLAVDAWSDVRTELATVAFTDLETITLFYSKDYLNQSGEIRPIYFQKLHALLALPSLTRIEFPADHVIIVPRVVCSAPSLKALVLENVWIMEDDLSPESQRRPRIESLKLWNCMVIMVEHDWLFPATNAAVDLSHLRHLDLWKVPRYMWNFVQSVSSTLEHLALDLTLPGVNLAIFPKLRHLEWHPSDDTVNMQRIRDVLGTLAPTNRVQTIIFWITASTASHVPRDFGAQIEALALPALRRAEVRIWHVEPAEVDTSLVREVVFPH
ncbi:hypothetical protein DFH09DRAFT_1354920 [Mycena vulgaris]|nr:hypothetical protein DFH09DRAFT_1354920 [Mycena vulgaris]